MDTICIDSNGDLNSTSAPIRRQGNKYILTGNIVNQTVLVQKDNVILDGAGYTLQGWSQTIGDKAIGISVPNRANVTITNFAISQFTQPVWLQNSSQITVKHNNITYGYPYSILVDSSINNTITGNRITGSSFSHGILQLVNSSYNTISDNTVTYSYTGIADYDGKENLIVHNSFRNVNESIISVSKGSIIFENSIMNGDTGLMIEGQKTVVSSNTIVNCSYGIYSNSLSGVFSENSVYNASTCLSLNGAPYLPLGNNTFYRNSFKGYNQAVDYQSQSKYVDHWDNGEEGNYWSSYTGSDGNGDGVGDIPYNLAANYTDNYPLMQLYMVASTDASLGNLFFAGAAVTALVGAAVIVCVYAKFRGRG